LFNQSINKRTQNSFQVRQSPTRQRKYLSQRQGNNIGRIQSELVERPNVNGKFEMIGAQFMLIKLDAFTYDWTMPTLLKYKSKQYMVVVIGIRNTCLGFLPAFCVVCFG